MTAMTGGAQASSIVFLGDTAPSSTPSIIALGAPAKVARAQPAARADPSLDPMQQALLQVRPGSWRAAPVLEASRPAMPTPSIIALGEPLPQVTNEKVAAIPQKSKHGPASSPMVIRGGISGSAFAPATPAPAAASSPARQTATSARRKPPEKPERREPAQPSPPAIPPPRTEAPS